MTQPLPLIEARGLVRHFPRPEGGAPRTVLAGASLSVQQGEAVAIVGPSGSGKTTLLNLLGCLDRPDAGTLRLGSDDLLALSEDQRATLRNRRVGLIFQTHLLLPQCDALENVLLPTLASGRSTPQDEARARKLLDAVGLSERFTHRPGQLSIGECQRVAVARALIMEPAVVLADEPTGALDAETAERLGDLLLSLRESEGLTLVVVTHSEALAARLDRSLRLTDGLLQASAPAPGSAPARGGSG